MSILKVIEILQYFLIKKNNVRFKYDLPNLWFKLRGLSNILAISLELRILNFIETVYYFSIKESIEISSVLLVMVFFLEYILFEIQSPNATRIIVLKILFFIRLLICSIWFSETVSFLENLTNCSKKSVQHEILLHFNFAGFSSNFWILRRFIFEAQLKYYIFQHFNVAFRPNYFNSQHFDLLLKIVFLCVRVSNMQVISGKP